MAEYIEREKLLTDLQEEIDFETTMYTEEQNKYFNMGLKCAVRNVKRLPAADVVEVCRCKDCEFVQPTQIKINGKELKTCELYKRPCFDNDFCSKGLRKESEVTE